MIKMRKIKLEKKKVGLIVLTLVILGFIGAFLVYLPARRVYSSARETVEEAKGLAFAAKQQDLVETQTKIKSTKDKLEKTQKRLAYFSLTRFIPLLGGYWRDADRLVRAGIYGLTAGEIFVESLEPYADILGLAEARGSFVDLPAEERIMTVVQTLDKVAPKLDEMGTQLGLARAEIDKINPGRYPSQVKGVSLRENLTNLKEEIDQTGNLFVDAQPLVRVLPSLLGEPEPKKYLVLFQNDKELRSTGGFLTAYAIFRLEHGKIIAEKSEDIYRLDESLTESFPAPDPILKYLPKVYNWHIRDTNLSPDFYVSMQKFEEFYKN
jgi:hypothetical protein